MAAEEEGQGEASAHSAARSFWTPPLTSTTTTATTTTTISLPPLRQWAGRSRCLPLPGQLPQPLLRSVDRAATGRRVGACCGGQGAKPPPRRGSLEREDTSQRCRLALPLPSLAAVVVAEEASQGEAVHLCSQQLRLRATGAPAWPEVSSSRYQHRPHGGQLLLLLRLSRPSSTLPTQPRHHHHQGRRSLSHLALRLQPRSRLRRHHHPFSTTSSRLAGRCR